MPDLPRSTWLAIAWSYIVTAATMAYFGWCLGASLSNYFLHWVPALLVGCLIVTILGLTIRMWTLLVWRVG
jgi:putative Mn2+ efflux pump MntP